MCPTHRAVWLVLCAAAACGSQEPDPSLSAAGERYEQVMADVTMNLTSEGARRGVVRADSAFVSLDAQRFDLRGMRATLLDADGRAVSVITAPTGVYTVPTGVLEASGGVAVGSINGDSLRTPYLIFDGASLELRTDSVFTHRWPAGSRTDTGWVSNAELRPVGRRRATR